MLLSVLLILDFLGPGTLVPKKKKNKVSAHFCLGYIKFYKKFLKGGKVSNNSTEHFISGHCFDFYEAQFFCFWSILMLSSVSFPMEDRQTDRQLQEQPDEDLPSTRQQLDKVCN